MDLDKIEELARAATPGPWEHERGYDGHVREIHPIDCSVLDDTNDHMCPGNKNANADAAYIAHLHPGTALELVAEVRRLRAMVERAYVYVEDWEPTPNGKAIDFALKDLREPWLTEARALLEGKPGQCQGGSGVLSCDCDWCKAQREARR